MYSDRKQVSGSLEMAGRGVGDKGLDYIGTHRKNWGMIMHIFITSTVMMVLWVGIC